ncbi:MAG: hypothetical protein Q4F67_01610, partial [Propionibacteriaceae bacterium]|nr:hypothetical protein [Propionibacteriaceae bacterium]
PPATGPTAPATTEPSADMREWTLTTAGWGPVSLGSPLPEALRGQLKPSWECIGPIIKDHQGNERMEFFTGQPDGSGRINTLHIVSPDIATRSGIRQGDSLAKLQQAYPNLERFESNADRPGDVHVLRDGANGLFFEMEPETNTVEHISVQPMSAFYPFRFQICGSP